MSQVDHVDDIAFSTAFGIDKILTTKPSGSFTVSATTRSTSTIPQTYGASIFPVMQYSINNTDWIDAGAVIYNASGGSDYQATCYTTSSSLVIVAENYTGSSATFYYRVDFVLEE